MLRRIILENFMSHARTEIDLADGLTVLTGPNNCGKSAVVAALQILATNGRSTHVMRHGAKRCRITVETDDVHTICWERKKTTVKYTLDGEDVHRVGTSIPDSLHDLLRLDRVEAETGKSKHEYDIHFGEQKSPVFLLGESGSRAASFFASSSDASRLVEMQHRHRLNLRDNKGEAKRLRAEIDNNASRLKSFEPVDEIAERIAQAEVSQKATQAAEQRIHLLKRLTGELDRSRSECQRLQTQRCVLEQLDQATTTTTDLDRANQTATRLRHVVDRVSGLQQHRRDCGLQAATLASLTPAPDLEPADACRNMHDQLGTASAQQVHVDRITESLSALESVPEMNDTKTLQTIIMQLTDVRQRNRAANSLQAAFKSLQKPAEETPTDGLRHLIAALTDQQAVVSRANAGAATLARLTAPAEQLDVDCLTSTIEKLNQLRSSVAKADSTADDTKRETSECEIQIRQFVKSNPTCVTCGASIDPETLMSTVPTIHDHSLVSATDADHVDRDA
ncbi:MAG: AAA family ATPase [Fuerstiella sp.]|nr:AAA family ATPase [Fuerstiella sp.]